MSLATRAQKGLYVVSASAAVIGSTSATVHRLDVPREFIAVAPVALAVAAIELGGFVLAAGAQERRDIGEHPYVRMVLANVVAFGAVAWQLYGHKDALEYGFFFAGFSLLSWFLVLIGMSESRRDALRARGELAKPLPQFGLWNWVFHPALTMAAAQRARGTDDRAAAHLAGVAQDRLDAETVRVASKIAYEQMVAEFGEDRAKLMRGILDFPALVDQARVAVLADSPRLASWIVDRASMPTPEVTEISEDVRPEVLSGEIVEPAPEVREEEIEEVSESRTVTKTVRRTSSRGLTEEQRERAVDMIKNRPELTASQIAREIEAPSGRNSITRLPEWVQFRS